MSDTGEEMTTVLSALTKILENQQKQSENRDQQITKIMQTQQELTERITKLSTPNHKKPSNASPPPRSALY